uniref:Uncharacterized protein n=1 Tax=Knipowitschia caucasica TaxID=637954 RepID=A0AAV2JBQ1_KNICA
MEFHNKNVDMSHRSRRRQRWTPRPNQPPLPIRLTNTVSVDSPQDQALSQHLLRQNQELKQQLEREQQRNQASQEGLLTQIENLKLEVVRDPGEIWAFKSRHQAHEAVSKLQEKERETHALKTQVSALRSALNQEKQATRKAQTSQTALLQLEVLEEKLQQLHREQLCSEKQSRLILEQQVQKLSEDLTSSQDYSTALELQVHELQDEVNGQHKKKRRRSWW